MVTLNCILFTLILLAIGGLTYAIKYLTACIKDLYESDIAVLKGFQELRRSHENTTHNTTLLIKKMTEIVKLAHSESEEEKPGEDEPPELIN